MSLENYLENSKAVCAGIFKARIIPILVLESVEQGIEVCKILKDTGLLCAEITFRTKKATGIIKEVSNAFPELLIGAGTVLNTTDLHQAFKSGAKFAIAPGLNEQVAAEAIESGYPFFPGVMTPTEIEKGLGLGITTFKYFPAQAAGGVNMIKSIIPPYKHLGIKLIPIGGVSLENLKDYLSIPEVLGVGGTWMATAELIKQNRLDVISKNCTEAKTLLTEWF